MAGCLMRILTGAEQLPAMLRLASALRDRDRDWCSWPGTSSVFYVRRFANNVNRQNEAGSSTARWYINPAWSWRKRAREMSSRRRSPMWTTAWRACESSPRRSLTRVWHFSDMCACCSITTGGLALCLPDLSAVFLYDRGEDEGRCPEDRGCL